MAFLKRRGHIIKIGTNTAKTHPRFKREFPNGYVTAHMHAEMNVLRFAKPGDELEVIRYRKIGQCWTMAKPCSHCMHHIRKAGIKRVRYTDWDGNWQEARL
jgi:deoxycytidylate deaminase